MDTLMLVTLGILPTIVISFLGYAMDFTQTKIKPKNAVLAYMFGVFLGVPAYFYEMRFEMLNWFSLSNPFEAFLASLIGIALIEEALKGVGLFLIMKIIFIDERLDILLVSIIVGMGFAGIENILYAQNLGWEVALFRSITSVPAHYVFACIMAYFVAMEYNPKNKNALKPFAQGVPVAILFHSLYDYFIIQDYSENLLLGSLVVLVIGLVLSYLIFRKLRSSNTIY